MRSRTERSSAGSTGDWSAIPGRILWQTTVGVALRGHPFFAVVRGVPHCVTTQGRPRRAAPTVAPVERLSHNASHGGIASYFAYPVD